MLYFSGAENHTYVPVAHEKGDCEDPRDPCSTQDPREEEHDAQIEALEGKHSVDVEKYGTEAEGRHLAVDESEKQLLVDVETVENVDGSTVFCDVVHFEVVNAAGEGSGTHKLFEVGVVETLLGAETNFALNLLENWNKKKEQSGPSDCWCYTVYIIIISFILYDLKIYKFTCFITKVSTLFQHQL